MIEMISLSLAIEIYNRLNLKSVTVIAYVRQHLLINYFNGHTYGGKLQTTEVCFLIILLMFLI